MRMLGIVDGCDCGSEWEGVGHSLPGARAPKWRSMAKWAYMFCDSDEHWSGICGVDGASKCMERDSPV